MSHQHQESVSSRISPPSDTAPLESPFPGSSLFCDLPLQPAAFGILPERNVPFKRIFPDFGFVDRKYIFLTPAFLLWPEKMCPDADCAGYRLQFPAPLPCSVTPQSTARSVCASTRSAAEMFLQPDKIAAVRVFGFWKKFLQRFHDFHLSPGSYS